MFIVTDEISKYYFNGSIAYTEDAIPVRRLHFFKVPSQMREDTLKAYFQSFGNVLKWRWYNDPNNMCEPCIGGGEVFSSFKDVERALLSYVHNLNGKDLENILEPCLRGDVLYASEEDAARVLMSRRHCIERLFFEVAASYSWKQPYANEIPSEEPSEPSIFLQLPDDCWFHILKYLDLRDKVRFARTCHRFRDTYKIASIALCKTIDSKQFSRMTPWDFRDFFQLTGDKVQNMKCYLGCIPKVKDEMLAFFASNCRNLISLTLDVAILTKDNMLKMPTSIEKLDLSKCGEIFDLDIICKHFFKLKELSFRVSKFSQNEWLAIVRENYCPSLVVLNISCDRDIDINFQILNQLPNLRRINLLDSPRLDLSRWGDNGLPEAAHDLLLKEDIHFNEYWRMDISLKYRTLIERINRFKSDRYYDIDELLDITMIIDI